MVSDLQPKFDSNPRTHVWLCFDNHCTQLCLAAVTISRQISQSRWQILRRKRRRRKLDLYIVPPRPRPKSGERESVRGWMSSSISGGLLTATRRRDGWPRKSERRDRGLFEFRRRTFPSRFHSRVSAVSDIAKYVRSPLNCFSKSIRH